MLSLGALFWTEFGFKTNKRRLFALLQANPGRKTDRQTKRQKDRQTKRQRETERKTERDTQTGRNTCNRLKKISIFFLKGM